MVLLGCLTPHCIKTPHLTAAHNAITHHIHLVSTGSIQQRPVIVWLIGCFVLVWLHWCCVWHDIVLWWHCTTGCTPSSSNFAWWCHLMNSHDVFASCLCVMFLWGAHLSVINDVMWMYCVDALCRHAVQEMSQMWWTDQSQIHWPALVQACDCVIGWLLCVSVVASVLCLAQHGLAMILHCRTSWLCTPSSGNFAWQCHLMSSHGVFTSCLCVMFLQGACLPATDNAMWMHHINMPCRHAVQGMSQIWQTD